MKIKRLIFFAALLLTVASGAWATPVPKVIWCSGNTTLYFVNDETTYGGEGNNTYDNASITGVYPLSSKNDWRNAAKDGCTKVVFDNSFASVRPTSCNVWFFEFYELTTIEGLTNLDTSEVIDLSYMFAQCQKLQSLDLSSFNTSKVTDMGTMFFNCFGLSTLDISSFDTSLVESIVDMFSGCKNIKNLTVATGWTKIGSREDCFFDFSPSTINLVLDDDKDSHCLLEEFKVLISGKPVNVTLRNRTLQKDGNWNTLCLPFNVTLTGSPLEGATLKEPNASYPSAAV